MPTSSTLRSALGSSAARRAPLQHCLRSNVRATSTAPSPLADKPRSIHDKSSDRERSTRLLPGGTNRYSSFTFSASQTKFARFNQQPACIFQGILHPRHYSTDNASPNDSDAVQYHVSKEDAKWLVDIYPEEQNDTGSSSQSSGPWVDDSTYAATSKLDEHRKSELTKDEVELLRELREEVRAPNSDEHHIWNMYQRIPEPRALYAQDVTKDIIRRLSVVEHKTRLGYLRFISLVSDLRAVGAEVPLAFWNTAMSYAARCLNQITATQVENALSIWREMEQEAHIKSDHVTFGILFDASAKAHRFILTDMILQEMNSRQLEYTRYFRHSLIYYYGLRRDPDNVRKAYSDFVNAGEIVDTAVINCVIFALIKCGDAGAAEFVFERVKALHASKTDTQLSPTGWYERRMLGRQLDAASRRQREANRATGLPEATDSAETASLRENTSVAPNVITYRTLVNHYAVSQGDIDRCAGLIDEMAQYELEVPGSIYLWLFCAFEIHGGVPYSQWNWRRLESTWTAFIDAVDASADVTNRRYALSSSNSASVAGEQPFFDPNERIKKWSRQRGSRTIDVTQTPQLAETDEGVPDETGEDFEYTPFSDEDETPLDEETRNDPKIYIGRTMALRVGKAFAKCSHLSRTAQVWAAMKKRWTPEDINDVEEVEGELAGLFAGREELFLGIVRQEEAQGRK